jgi:PhnB protein
MLGGMTTKSDYRTVSPYLLASDAAAWIEFTVRVFGGRERNRTTDNAGRIVHAEVQLGDSVLMVGESNDGKHREASLQVFVDDVDATYHWALEAGATSEGAPEDKPYGGRGAAVVDANGTHWYLSDGWA